MKNTTTEAIAEFEKKWPHLLYDGDEDGGYDVRPYLISFLKEKLEEAYRAGREDAVKSLRSGTWADDNGMWHFSNVHLESAIQTDKSITDVMEKVDAQVGEV